MFNRTGVRTRLHTPLDKAAMSSTSADASAGEQSSTNTAAAVVNGKKKRKTDSVANDRAKLEYAGHKLPSDLADRRRVRNMLSAKVHRMKEQDALNAVRTELDASNDTISSLKQQLSAVSPESSVGSFGHVYWWRSVTRSR